MFKSVNVFQMAVLVLILVGVVMIFMRQNNTCVMNNDDVTEGFVLNKYNNKRVGNRANHVIQSWGNASQYTGDLKLVMDRFNLPIHPTDDYKNYCTTRAALGGCQSNITDCVDECPPGMG